MITFLINPTANFTSPKWATFINFNFMTIIYKIYSSS